MKTIKSIIILSILLIAFNCVKIFAQNKIYELDSAKYGPGKVYYKTEKPAEFPGGKESIEEFFRMKFDAYAEGMDMGGPKEGVVKARFIVEPNGKIKYVEIIKHYTNTYDEEMITTLQAMPKWNPAMVDGKPVRSFMMYGWGLNFIGR